MARIDREKNREYQKKWYEKNKAVHFKRMKEREKRIKVRLQEYKSTLVCCICGERHLACIDFHHIDPKEKEVGISKAVHMGWGWEKIMKEISKCQIVCSNCHKKIHWTAMNESTWGK